MNKNDMWQLFKATGKVLYYLKYKSMDDMEEIESSKEDVKADD